MDKSSIGIVLLAGLFTMFALIPTVFIIGMEFKSTMKKIRKIRRNKAKRSQDVSVHA